VSQSRALESVPASANDTRPKASRFELLALHRFFTSREPTVRPFSFQFSFLKILCAAQVSQVASELKTSAYTPRMCILGSREVYCIHPVVSARPNKNAEWSGFLLHGGGWDVLALSSPITPSGTRRTQRVGTGVDEAPEDARERCNQSPHKKHSGGLHWDGPQTARCSHYEQGRMALAKAKVTDSQHRAWRPPLANSFH